MKFKAGDKVWARCDRADLNLTGVKAGVVEGPSDMCNLWWPGDGPWYLVLIEGHRSGDVSGLWTGRERNIWPRDEDGRQVGSWENSALVWRPNKETVA